MTKQTTPTKAILIADRALLVELAEQAHQARKAAAATPTEFNFISADSQKARDCALRAEVLLTVARASQVGKRHEAALELAVQGEHEKVWDYFDDQAEALRG